MPLAARWSRVVFGRPEREEGFCPTPCSTASGLLRRLRLLAMTGRGRERSGSRPTETPLCGGHAVSLFPSGDGIPISSRASYRIVRLGLPEALGRAGGIGHNHGK